MAPFFCVFFVDSKKLYTDDLVNAVVITGKSVTLCLLTFPFPSSNLCYPTTPGATG
jgi:hypothetical protein